MVAALLRPIFNADTGEDARELVSDALERLRKPLPKLAELLEEAEEDLLSFYGFPRDHAPKLRSTNPLERVNREIGRRTDVGGTFPNDRFARADRSPRRLVRLQPEHRAALSHPVLRLEARRLLRPRRACRG
jgi:transposase-like protein